MFRNKIKADKFDDWVAVFETSTDVEAQMVRNYLLDKDVECQILSKRDSAYNLNVGEMALVYLYVPKVKEEKAKELLDEWNNGSVEIDEYTVEDDD